MTIFLALGIPALVMVALNGWLIYSFQQSQGQVAARVDRLASRSAGRPIVAESAVAPPVSAAPRFVLPDLDGRNVSLATLMAAGKHVLLTFTDPKCGPCYELLTDIGGWERFYGDRLTIVTVSAGDLEQNRALAREYGLGTVLLQDEHELADAFDLPMIPAAVLIAPDGCVTASARGTDPVREVVATALGLALPPREEAPVTALQPGDRVGPLHRPDLDGNLVDLGASRVHPTLVVFWSPGCSHCQELLSDLRDWEADPRIPPMAIVTAGPVALNREAGLRSVMIPDDDSTVKSTFGVPGTPAAVVVSSEGVVVTGPVRGTTGIRALVAHYLSRTPVAA